MAALLVGNLQVNGNTNATGTKSAVVETSSGKRELYSEEATEVWFSDYGFGRLQGGKVFITLDPIYSETVNLALPYHVFVQSYGDADLVVEQRTTRGFSVRARSGAQDAEFSYRIVSRRRGHEKKRLKVSASDR